MGSLASILWLLALREEAVNEGLWEFLKVGAVTMPLALAAAVLGRWWDGRAPPPPGGGVGD
jgi:arsenical pump membrane protein